MALLECPECKQEVSERDYFCIECGYPRSGWSANKSPARPDRPRSAGSAKSPGRPDRSFEATHPHHAKAWHTTDNKGVKPSDVFVEFDNKLVVSWNPPCGHVFRRQIKNWIQNPVCPECGEIPEGIRHRSKNRAPREVRPAKLHQQDQAKDQDPVKIYESKAPTENIADKVMTWGTAISIPVVLYLLYRVANWLLKALTGLELNPADLF